MVRKKRRVEPYSLYQKRTFQLTPDEAEERVDIFTRGERLVAGEENARALLLSRVGAARKVLSRKRAEDGFSVRIMLKWKTQEGKWVRKGIQYHTFKGFEAAIEELAKHPELSSLVSGDPYDPDKQREIASKTKRIESVSFSKYVRRKWDPKKKTRWSTNSVRKRGTKPKPKKGKKGGEASKAARAKGKGKAARGLRSRKQQRRRK